jgi:hypothetical protein
MIEAIAGGGCGLLLFVLWVLFGAYVGGRVERKIKKGFKP